MLSCPWVTICGQVRPPIIQNLRLAQLVFCSWCGRLSARTFFQAELPILHGFQLLTACWSGFACRWSHPSSKTFLGCQPHLAHLSILHHFSPTCPWQIAPLQCPWSSPYLSMTWTSRRTRSTMRNQRMKCSEKRGCQRSCMRGSWRLCCW